jgi:anti-sigma factor RsiW
MTHPEELLAPYVDGSLPEADRAAVTAHLAGCRRCSQEVVLATDALSALRALPLASPPPGMGERAVQSMAPTGSAGGRRWAWIAVAAAVVIVAGLTLPKIGGTSGGAGRNHKAESSGFGSAAATATGVEVVATDFDPARLTELARSFVAESSGTVTSASGTPIGASAPLAPSGAARPASVAEANHCIFTAFRRAPGALVRVLQASFRGTPAYLGFYEEGPGAGQPADLLTIRVASIDGCAPLSESQARL